MTEAHLSPEIDDQTLVSRSTNLIASSIHDETLMMDIASGLYYGLDDIGSVIWQRLEQPRAFGELVDGLVAEFDADRTVIAADVRKLLSVLAEHKIVSLV